MAALGLGLLARLPRGAPRGHMQRPVHRLLSYPGTVATDARREEEPSANVQTGDGAVRSALQGRPGCRDPGRGLAGRLQPRIQPQDLGPSRLLLLVEGLGLPDVSSFQNDRHDTDDTSPIDCHLLHGG